MGRRFMMLAARPLPVHDASFLPSHRFLIACSLRSHSLIHEARKRKNGDGGGGGDAGGLERDAPTRRIEQDARRDEGGDNTDGQASNETPQRDGRHETGKRDAI